MNLNFRSLIFHTEDPGSVAEFVAYVLDLNLEAKNCDQYELHNPLWSQLPDYICFRKAKKSKSPDFSFDIVLGIESKSDWENQFKKIVFYLHQNGLNDKFAPSKEVRKPGGLAFHVTLLPGVKLEFFHPFENHHTKAMNLANSLSMGRLDDKKIIIN